MADSKRTPVYFLGIGGPNFIEDKDHPAFAKLAAIGEEITTKVKPKAIVIFSAHWQDGPNKIQINVAENEPIIYDYEGFPPHYYEVDYPNKGSREIAEQVIKKFEAAGVNIERTQRGLDHGVWMGFLAAFDPEKNPLNVPIVQVSLYDNEDADAHYRLGQILEEMRDENILIIGAGMGVHNTADYRATRKTLENMPYTVTFENALTEAITSKPDVRQQKMADLLKRSDIRDAHPTFDHILPAHIAAGAAGADVAEKLWDLPERGINWAQYRFGTA